MGRVAMDWISIAWPMAAAACVTVGLINLTVGLAPPTRAARLLFSVGAFAVALVFGTELALTRADSPAHYLGLLRSLHVLTAVALASLTAFVAVFFRNGSHRLGLAGVGLYAVALVFDFLPGPGLVYREITGLETLKTFGGATYTMAEGMPNPWNALKYLAVLVIVLFVADVSLRLWRSGAQRRAAVVGGVALLFLAAGAHSALVDIGVVRTPYLMSWAYLAILLALGRELAGDLLPRLPRREEGSDVSLEISAQRDELVHLSRVAMLGELAGSLAHELNQPLTAILSNAEAAVRFLARDPIDVSELRSLLEDIAADDKRAGEVISRMRALLRKEEVHYRPLDVNQVVLDVLKLMRSDLLIRRVGVSAELAPTLPLVDGDRIQLQQVLVNLVMNGCDAMDGSGTDRQLTLRTITTPSEEVEVSVVDHGRGIPSKDLERVFDPFVSTKMDGVGLGLTVCRGIIAAHHGRLWGTNNADNGATFHFTLPTHGV